MRLDAIKVTFSKRKTATKREMDENETKLVDVEQFEIQDQKSSNVILFSDYTPSDILGIVRVSPKLQCSICSPL